MNMLDKAKILVESQKAEAIRTIAIAKEAEQKAFDIQMEAVLERFFQRGVDEKKFIDIGQIPFICDDVRVIKLALKDINIKMERIEPLLQATIGGKLLYKIFLIIGSIAMGWVAFRQTFGI